MSQPVTVPLVEHIDLSDDEDDVKIVEETERQAPSGAKGQKRQDGKKKKNNK